MPHPEYEKYGRQVEEARKDEEARSADPQAWLANVRRQHEVRFKIFLLLIFLRRPEGSLCFRNSWKASKNAKSEKPR